MSATVPHWQAGLDVMNANRPLANAKPQDIINRYLADESTKDIAASLGVARSALNMWLLRTCQDEWREAQVARAITALEKAKEGMESAEDGLALTRAREQLKGAQWELERLVSRLYGSKQEVTHNHQVTVSAGLVGRSSDLMKRLTADTSSATVSHKALISNDSIVDAEILPTNTPTTDE